jgi:hypothetical protein
VQQENSAEYSTEGRRDMSSRTAKFTHTMCHHAHPGPAVGVALNSKKVVNEKAKYCSKICVCTHPVSVLLLGLHQQATPIAAHHLDL